MLSRSTLRLVLIVSCAHALVHIFELALPSVEMLMAEDYGVGKSTMGLLSTYWRLPWGFGALGAGWLVDRVGSQRMLAVYLLGCAATCCLVGLTLPLPWLFVVMFTMGAFASIYHPAGLALISHATTLENRPRALGLHGIFGSAGIGSAPFLAALLLTLGFTWQQYYFGLAAAGLVLESCSCGDRSAKILNYLRPSHRSNRRNRMRRTTVRSSRSRRWPFSRDSFTQPC